tara:strand:- start:77 stop:706 length:630 start_codon:yes stop_codon:yes gene_type:complete
MPWLKKSTDVIDAFSNKWLRLSDPHSQRWNMDERVKLLQSDSSALLSGGPAETLANQAASEVAYSGTVTIPACEAGTRIRICAGFRYITANGTNTAVTKVKIGSAGVLQTRSAFNVHDVAGDVQFYECEFVVRSSTAIIGTATFQGKEANSAVDLATTSLDVSSNLDFSGEQTLSATIQWSHQHANNSCALEYLTCEIIEPAVSTGPVN